MARFVARQAIAQQSAKRGPPDFGNWNTIYRRFRDWARCGVFERIFNGLPDQPDMEMAMIDDTIVTVHRACDLKDCRRISLRTDKTDPSFGAVINACAALLNSE